MVVNRSLATTLLLLPFLACGKSKSDNKNDAETTGGVTGKLEFGIASSAFTAPSTSLALAALTPVNSSDYASAPFKATSILSGAPDEFTIYVKKITLGGSQASGAIVNVNVFEDKEGKPIRISGSSVDLSELFLVKKCYKGDGSPFPVKEGESCECGVDSAGKLVKKVDKTDEKTGKTIKACDIENMTKPPTGLVDVAVGAYTTLQMEYTTKAYAKGCLSGYFRATATGVGDTTLPHTYCTRSAGDLFEGGSGVNLAVFENQTAEVMEVPLSGLSAKGFDTKAVAFSVSYPIGGEIKIEAEKTARLTLLIDANRLLRFETSVRNDQKPVVSGWPKTRPFFYSTTFRDSSFVFIGEPGEIRGYKWAANACSGDNTSCTGSQQPFYLEGWLTTIARKAADPFLLNFMPDDDATLTTIKGTNFSGKMDRKTGSRIQTAHPESYVKGSDGSIKMTYLLDDKIGTVTLPSSPDALETPVSGTFKGFQNLSGDITLERKL